MKDILNLKLYKKCARIPDLSEIRIVTLGDTSHGGSDTIKGQKRILCGLFFGVTDNYQRNYLPM